MPRALIAVLRSVTCRCMLSGFTDHFGSIAMPSPANSAIMTMDTPKVHASCLKKCCTVTLYRFGRYSSYRDMRAYARRCAASASSRFV